MKVVRNMLNPPVSKGEVFTKPSMTIPDQTMTVKEIMDRYARGLPIDGAKIPIYEGEEYLPDPRTLDLVDRQQMAQEFRQELSEMEARRKPSTSAAEVITAEEVPSSPPIDNQLNLPLPNDQ